MEYKIKTAKLATIKNEFDTEANKLAKKTSVFYRGAFSTSGALSQALGKVNQNYSNLTLNLKNLGKFLEKYVSDVEAFESAMSGSGGSVSASQAISYVRGNQGLAKSKSFSFEMDSSTLFPMRSVPSKQPSSTASSASTPTPTSGGEASQVGPGSGSGVSASPSPSQSSMSSEFNYNMEDLDLNMDFNFDMGSFDLNLDSLNRISLGDLNLSLENLADLNFNLPDLSLITMGTLGNFQGIDLGNLDFASLGNLSLTSLGDLSNLDLSSLKNILQLDLTILGDLSSIDLSNLGDLDLNLAHTIILADLLGIENLDLSDLSSLSFDQLLSHLNLANVDVNSYTLNAHTFQLLQQQIELGNLTELEALNAIHQLFPGTIDFDFDQIANLSTLSSLVTPVDLSTIDTGALGGSNVSSALMLGFGLFGGGLARGAFGSQSEKSAKTSFSSVSDSNVAPRRGSAFAGLLDGTMSGASSDFQADEATILESRYLVDDSNDHQEIWEQTGVSILSQFLKVNYDLVSQYIFSNLTRFNRVKKETSFLDLVNDAKSVRFPKRYDKMMERIFFLIPSVFPKLEQYQYLYKEFQEHPNFPLEIYLNSLRVIKNREVLNARPKWLVPDEITIPKCHAFVSKLSTVDQVVNCGSVKEVLSFNSIFFEINQSLSEVLQYYQKVIKEEVPKVFHSNIVITEASSSFDVIYERLDSFSKQAELNSLDYTEGKDFLASWYQSLTNEQQRLLSFQDLYRVCEDQSVDFIHVLRLEKGENDYLYYAFSEGVGLREIYQDEVRTLFKVGFRFKED